MFVPQVLSPAGNREKCSTALLYGADAVFLGGKVHNLRAAAEGFGPEDLAWAVQEAAKTQAHIYFCLNSLPMQKDMASLPKVIEEAASAGVHAFIVADPGIFRLVKKYAPSVPIHLSTQMNTTNAEALAFWHDLGAKRVNLARELTSRDIHALTQALPTTAPGLELEVFTHGAMCLAVSGQCLLSAWVNERSANQGRCSQPCRFEYRVMDSVQAGDTPGPSAIARSSCTAQAEVLVEEKLRTSESPSGPVPLWGVRAGGSGGEGGYSSLWATDDLCLMPWLPWLAQHKIAACKIEGRMKGAAYVAHVTDAYKTALTAIKQGQSFNYHHYMPELFATASRVLSSGFFLPHKRRNLSQEYGAGRVAGRGPEVHSLAARVREPASNDGSCYIIEVRGQWKVSKTMEVMLPGLRRPQVEHGGYWLEAMNGEKVSVVNPGQCARLCLAAELPVIPAGAFIRTVK